MLILLTLSLLPSSCKNGTSDIDPACNIAVNGTQSSKPFYILLNDTIFNSLTDVTNKDKIMQNKNKEHPMMQILQMLNKYFSSPPNIADSSTLVNIPQGSDIYFYTPAAAHVLDHGSSSKNYKKSFQHISKLIPTLATASLDLENIYYNTPPQAPLVPNIKLSKRIQKGPQKTLDVLAYLTNLLNKSNQFHKMPMSKLFSKPANTMSSKTQLVNARKDDAIYRSTPPATRAASKAPILKGQFSILKDPSLSIGGRIDVAEYILRSYTNDRNMSQKAYAVPRAMLSKLKGFGASQNVAETTSAAVNILQSNKDTINVSIKDRVSHQPEVRKWNAKPQATIKSTFVTISLLLNDENIFNKNAMLYTTRESEMKKRHTKSQIATKSTFLPINSLVGDGLTAFGEQEEAESIMDPELMRSSSGPGDALNNHKIAVPYPGKAAFGELQETKKIVIPPELMRASLRAEDVLNDYKSTRNKSVEDHVWHKPKIKKRYTKQKLTTKSTFGTLSLLLGVETSSNKSVEDRVSRKPKIKKRYSKQKLTTKSTFGTLSLLLGYENIMPPSDPGAFSEQEATKEFDISSKLMRASSQPESFLNEYKSTTDKTVEDRISLEPKTKKRYTKQRATTKRTFVPINSLLGDEIIIPSPSGDALSKPEATTEITIPPKLMRASSEPRNVLNGYKSASNKTVKDRVLRKLEKRNKFTKTHVTTKPTFVRKNTLVTDVMPEESTRELNLDDYYKKMKESSTGYLSIAFETLCEQLAFMPPKHITELVTHVDNVVRKMQNAGHLQWLGQPMTTILQDLSIMLSEEPVDDLQLRAMVLMSLMRDRRKIVGTDVNDILDFADNLIHKDDGEHLLKVMQDFRQYPNVTKSGKKICKKLIGAFEAPFFHLTSSMGLKQLVKSANQAFANRFPQYSHLQIDNDRFIDELGSKISNYSSNVRIVQDLIRFTKRSIHSNVTRRGKKHKNSSKHKEKSKPKDSFKHKGPTKDEVLSEHKHALKHTRDSENKVKRLSKDKHNSKKGTHRSKDNIPYINSIVATRKHKHIHPGLLVG